MDILRIALERSVTARDAVRVIAGLMERYGQGGNASFDGTFHYDNAYLITDGRESWHVETAGKHYWAAKQVYREYSISNYLSLDTPDLMHESVLENAREKGYGIAEPFHFAQAYADWTNSLNQSGLLRRACTFPQANVADRGFTENDMLKILRSHYTENEWTRGGDCVCMHARNPVNPGDLDCQTTCAMIAVCTGKDTVMWGTGMSTTCVAPFQPFWFDAYSKKQVFDYSAQEAAMDEWLRREGINRAILAGKICAKEYKKELYAMEKDWFARVDRVSCDRESRQALCDQIADEAEAFLDKWLEKAKESEGEAIGSEGFRKWWKHKTEMLGKDRRIAY